MASFNNDLPQEGSSRNRPPYFDGTDYPYWKSWMQTFLKSVDLQIWTIIENGFEFRTTLGDDGQRIPKKVKKFNDVELKEAQWNAKARKFITNALGRDEHFRVSSCRTAKEMWKVLESTYESTSSSSSEEEDNSCLTEKKDDKESEEQMCLKAKSSKWYLDSGCSKHMTGDVTRFASIIMKQQGHVTFGDNNKGRILGIGKIGNASSTLIEGVLLVEGLKHNLLSISQLCDKQFKIVFDSMTCHIISLVDDEVKFIGHRIDNVYMLDIDACSSSDATCLISKNDETWLWHRRIAHIGMNHLNKLIKHDLVIGLPKLKFEKDRLCDACQKGKQTKTSFKSKNVVSTSRELDV